MSSLRRQPLSLSLEALGPALPVVCLDGERVPFPLPMSAFRVRASTSVPVQAFRQHVRPSGQPALRSSFSRRQRPHSPAGVAVHRSGGPDALCRRGPNHALQRTEAGVGLVPYIMPCFASPSLSLSPLGHQKLRIREPAALCSSRFHACSRRSRTSCALLGSPTAPLACLCRQRRRVCSCVPGEADAWADLRRLHQRLEA